MRDEERGKLKEIAKEAMKEYLAEYRPMPVSDQNVSNQSGSRITIPANCCQVTEIIIRVGPPEAVQGLSQVGMPTCVPLCVPCCPPCCPPSYVPSAYLETDIPLDAESKMLFQKIMEVTRDTPGELIHKLGREIGARRLSEDIRRFATDLGIVGQKKL